MSARSQPATVTDHESDEIRRGSVPTIPDLSGAIPTSEARSKRRIASLEGELEMFRQEKGTKQRFVYRLRTCSILLPFILEKQLSTSRKAGQSAA